MRPPRLFYAFLASVAAAGLCTPLLISGATADAAQLLKEAVSIELPPPPPPRPPEKEPFTLTAVGDVMLSRTVATVIRRQYDIHFPFRKTTELLQRGDVTFGNLENPVVDGADVAPLSMNFRADPKTVPALSTAGFDVFSLANNHLGDRGAEGVRSTLRALSGAGMLTAGAGRNDTEAHRPALFTLKGQRVAVLAYQDARFIPADYHAGANQPGVAIMHAERLRQDVHAASGADVIIVSMHAGAEYQPEPDSVQRAFAHAAVDAGADLVLGHHPHVLQPLERYNGKLIVYSLGNFVFDQMWSDDTRRSAVLAITFSSGGTVTDIAAAPVVIEQYAQPRPATAEEAASILQRFRTTFTPGNGPWWQAEIDSIQEAAQPAAQ